MICNLPSNRPVAQVIRHTLSRRKAQRILSPFIPPAATGPTARTSGRISLPSNRLQS